MSRIFSSVLHLDGFGRNSRSYPGLRLKAGRSAASSWSTTYNLAAAEVDLKAVLTDYAPADHEFALVEELRSIVAARTLAAQPILTVAEIDRARKAFESGLVPLVLQHAD